MSTTSVTPLPNRANLAQLKKRAKEVSTERGVKLSEAQFQLAKDYGFSSWTALKHHVELVTALTRTPDQFEGEDFLTLACVTYGDDAPARRVQAEELLAADPTLATRDIWHAAATATVDGLRGNAAAEGGPFAWEPLLYLCYSRIPSTATATLATATALLDSGANPNAGFLWHGLPSPFTALTGALGGGENDQPPHPHGIALARLLLERGADPNDSQGLYNRMFRPENDHLALLCEFGLGQGDGGPWRQRLGVQAESIGQMLQRQLDWAAVHNMRDRIALLLDNGVDINMQLVDGMRAIDRATTSGHIDLVGDLYERGAQQSPLEAHEVVVGFVLSVDRANVEAMKEIDAGVIDKAIAWRPSLVVQAAEQGSVDAARYAVELGWDVNALGRADLPLEMPWETALHTAVHQSDKVMVAALMQMGADPSIKDARFEGTPVDWAEHFGHTEMANLVKVLSP